MYSAQIGVYFCCSQFFRPAAEDDMLFNYFRSRFINSNTFSLLSDDHDRDVRPRPSISSCEKAADESNANAILLHLCSSGMGTGRA